MWSATNAATRSRGVSKVTFLFLFVDFDRTHLGEMVAAKFWGSTCIAVCKGKVYCLGTTSSCPIDESVDVRTHIHFRHIRGLHLCTVSTIFFHRKYHGGIPKVYFVDTPIFSDFHINSNQANPRSVRNPPVDLLKMVSPPFKTPSPSLYLPSSRAPPPLLSSHHMHQPDGFEIPNGSVPTTSLLRNDAAPPLLGGPSLFYSILPCREPTRCMECGARSTQYIQ